MRGFASLNPWYRDPEIERILNQSDAEAIASDWKAVGNDIRESMNQSEGERDS
jgi:hypothetical protein